MATYTSFTASVNLPMVDPAALLVALRVVDPTAGFYSTGAGTYVVKTTIVPTALQKTALQSAIDNAVAITPARVAQNLIDTMPIFEKAILLTLLDQINVLRTRAGLSTVSVAQGIQAVRDKAGTL